VKYLLKNIIDAGIEKHEEAIDGPDGYKNRGDEQQSLEEVSDYSPGFGFKPLL
jgi:hypothetical protein